MHQFNSAGASSIWPGSGDDSGSGGLDPHPYLEPVLARRSVDCAIVCGACGQVFGKRDGDVLLLQHDQFCGRHWHGWRLAENVLPNSAGGRWQLAEDDFAAVPNPDISLELLPAIIECPFCRVPNLFDPSLLNLNPQQSVARAHRTRRQRVLPRSSMS